MTPARAGACAKWRRALSPEDVQKVDRAHIAVAPDMKVMPSLIRGSPQTITLARRFASHRHSLRIPSACGVFQGEAMEPHSIVVISLHNRQRKNSGASLLTFTNAGVTVRGIDLSSFDDFVSQVMHPEGDRIGLAHTYFFRCCASNDRAGRAARLDSFAGRMCSRKRRAAHCETIWRNSFEQKRLALARKI